MAVEMLRPKMARGRVAVGKTKFDEDFVDHGRHGETFIPGTTIRRLRPVRLGPRCIAFPSDEVDALIEALRAHRDRRDRP